MKHEILIHYRKEKNYWDVSAPLKEKNEFLKLNNQGSRNSWYAKGSSHKEGIDYHELFSHVLKYKKIWVLLAIVNALDLKLENFDVKTTFLHGTVSRA